MAKNDKTESTFTPEIDTFDTESNSNDVVIDFTNVAEDAGFEPIPVGTYEAAISGMEIRTSKKGNPMVSVTFDVQNEDYKNRKLFTHFVLNNDISLGRLKKFLINVFPDLELRSVNLAEFCRTGVWMGRACSLNVTQRPYDGRITNDVKEVMAPSSDSFFG